MRHLVRTAILVVVVMAIFTISIFPPEKNLRLGKDLSGGVSLVYSLAIGPGEDSASTIARTIDVLKRRVDPDGLFEIAMVAQGRDRIEITMPLPNEHKNPRVRGIDLVWLVPSTRAKSSKAHGD